MSRLSRILDDLVNEIPRRLTGRALGRWLVPKSSGTVRNVGRAVEELEPRDVPSLLGQQLFPSNYPINQNIANAPVAANSATVITHIGTSIKIHPDLGYDNPSGPYGTSQIYGIPFNVVHGNSVAKVNVIINNYASESDIVPVPIPANAVIEGDYQDGPNLHGGGYNSGQRGDSHLLIWDEDNNVAYELFGVSRPSDPTLFPNTSNVELPHTDGLWHAAQETVWNMATDSFRTLGYTSADAGGLSLLAGLIRPDEALPVSQGGQGAIDHALRFTLPQSDINPQYIYPASHQIYTSQSSTSLPLGARLRLENTPAVDALIAKMGPEAQIVATAMQQYGLILADAGSSMFVTGASASVDANNNNDLTWPDSWGGGGLSDILGLESLTAADFQVVNLTPIVTGLSATTGSAGNTVTITGQNFSGAAGNLSVYFGGTAATNVTYVSDTQITAVAPSGSGTVDVTVQSGVNEQDTVSSNPNANVTKPIFGYGTSATSSADKFTYTFPTTTLLTDKGLSPATADGSIEQGFSPSFTVVVTPASNGPATGTVQLKDAANGNASIGSAQTLVNGSVTFSVAATAGNNFGAGTHKLFAVYTPTGSFNPSTSSQVGQVIDAVFKVQTLGTGSSRNFTPTATGYQVVFNAPLKASTLNIFGSGAASTTLVTASNAAIGSLVVDPTDTEATFVTTGTFSSHIPEDGELTPGASYTATLSGTNANPFTDVNGNVLGSSSSSGGSDFTDMFNAMAAAPLVSVPYFARGYTQPVNIPNTGSGLPISISVPSGTSAVTSFSFQLAYNPALLTVTGGSIVAGGFSGSVSVLSPGQLQITASGGSLAAGSVTEVVSLSASVPVTAPYADKDLLQVEAVSINGGSNNGLAGAAVHITSFLDNTQGPTAPNNYSGQDAFNILGVYSGVSTGIIKYNLLDPTILCDDSASGRISSATALDTMVFASGASRPEIPTMPAPFSISVASESGNTVTITTSSANNFVAGEEVIIGGVSATGYNGTYTIAKIVDSTHFTYTDSTSGLGSGTGGTAQPTTTTGGPDPYMFLNPTRSTTAGSSVIEAVYLDITNAKGLTYDSDDIAISFNPKLFQVSQVQVGNYPIIGASNLVEYANVNNTLGTLMISEFTSNANGVFLPSGTTGAIVEFTITALSTASRGKSVIKLNANIGTHYTDVNGGAATLTPAPDNTPYNRKTDTVFSILKQVAKVAKNQPVIERPTLLLSDNSNNTAHNITIGVVTTNTNSDLQSMGTMGENAYLSMMAASAGSVSPTPALNNSASNLFTVGESVGIEQSDLPQFDLILASVTISNPSFNPRAG